MKSPLCLLIPQDLEPGEESGLGRRETFFPEAKRASVIMPAAKPKNLPERERGELPFPQHTQALPIWMFRSQ